MTSVTDRSRQMRQSMSPPEARLWVALKRCGTTASTSGASAFPRLFSGFACHDRRLAIEVDGAMHDYRIEHDRTRDAVLSREGYRTMRFSNADVRDNLEGVLIGMRTALASHSPTRPSLRSGAPPHEGEGE